MRRSAGIAAVLALASLLPAGCSKGAAARDAGNWVSFYTSPRDHSQYYYDRTGFEPGGDQIQARWKRVNPQGGMTLYRIELHCRARTFTERGTHIVDPDGQERDVPNGELWVDHPIPADTSTEAFARRFCSA